MNKRFTFNNFSNDWIESNFTSRNGETKLGQEISINDSSRKFQILGVKESVGPQLNLGRPGAENAFDCFVGRFLNMQSNRFLTGNDINFSGVITVNPSSELYSSDWINELDQLIINWATTVYQANCIPIVIGGGHNNAYPLISAYKKTFSKPISVVNLDPHADFRALEGRHSGNPFSYAAKEGSLNKYALLGLSESYNNEHILKELDTFNANYCFFEEWLDDSNAFEKDLNETFEFISLSEFGIELDLDSIAFMPTSAFSPSGISVDEARMYIRKFASSNNVQYLHLPEGAPQTEVEKAIVGKSLAFFVSDFIKKRK
ncbi:MAG: formimidoylglutamase [Fluviicola sp.]|jgi:formiminoglutamase